MNWETTFSERSRLMKRNAVRELLKVTAQPDIISFAGGLPAAELFPIDRVKKAADIVLSKIGPPSLQYSETEGIGQLRDYLAEQFSARCLPVGRENVLVTTGAQQALDLIGRVFLNPDDRVVVENPTYLALLSSWRPLGAQFIPVATDADGMKVNMMSSLLEQHRPKLIYLIPNFQNPQGSTLSLGRRQQLLDLSIQYQVPIIEDNAYGALRYDGEPVPDLWQINVARPETRRAQILHVGTFSKVLMPGLRIGWVTAPQLVIDRLVLAKQAADLHTSTLNQYVALELLHANYLNEVLPKILSCYRTRRDAMLDALDRYFPSSIQWTRPQGGMFLLANFPEDVNTAELLPKALEQRVAYVPGGEFHPDGAGQNTMRLNFSNASPERIDEGIRRLARVFNRSEQYDSTIQRSARTF